MSDEQTPDNVRALPGNISFDLDNVQRDPKDIKPIFTVTVAGREITMTDPQELDWKDLLLLESPMDFLQYTLGSADKAFLLKQDIEGWRFGKLMEAYYAHYDLDEKMRQARRQQQLSGI